MTTTMNTTKRQQIEELITNAENYRGFVGCNLTTEVFCIETAINEGRTPNTFSAEGNSRQYFFANVTRWLINEIADNQDYWHNNNTYSEVFDILATTQKLAWMEIAKTEDVDRVILKIAGMLEEGILG